MEDPRRFRVYRSIEEVAAAPPPRPAVITPGIFDGLHRGHRRVLEDLERWAEGIHGVPAVVTFDPHPSRVLTGSAPPMVHSIPHRLLLLERAGVGAVLLLRFDRRVAAWSPEEFVERLVRGAFRSSCILLGFDSAIGHRRRGTFEYLSARARDLGIEVRRSPPVVLGGERISSTLVRRAVLDGDLDRFQQLTGRPYSLLGEVIRGDRRGRTIGFPTANLRIGAGAVVPAGVYFGLADEVDPPRSGNGRGTEKADGLPRGAACLRRRPALVNIGHRPTFGAGGVPAAERFDPATGHVEAHILDFDGDLYGRFLELHILARHRAEERFDGIDALRAQIERDEAAFRSWLETSRGAGDAAEGAGEGRAR